VAAVRRRVCATLLASALLLTGTACAPGTPDADSWRADAKRAVGDVLSAVQTARLGLAQARAGRLTHAYLQTVLVDAERNGGMSAQKLSSVQPPDVERRRSADVTDELDQANGVLTDARIAVVAHDTGTYAEAQDRLANVADDLNILEAALAHPPKEAS
jgi:hypothetical protein